VSSALGEFIGDVHCTVAGKEMGDAIYVYVLQTENISPCMHLYFFKADFLSG